MLSRVPLNNRLVSNKWIINACCGFRYKSQQVPVVQNAEENYEKQIKVFQTLNNITRKVRTKQPQKPPFVKNFLLGKFDTDILTYPQLTKEDTKILEQNVEQVKKLMKQSHMSQSSSLSKHIRQNLSDYRCIGLQASQLMDGLECNATETLAYIEALSESSLRNQIVNNEQLGVQTLNKFANDILKNKYLQQLMKGEILSATCIYEFNAKDLNIFQTKAELSSDEKSWNLHGKKSFVINGKAADVFLVFAVTKVVKKDIIKEQRITAFVVDKNSPGVSIEEFNNSEVDIVNVSFTNTPIPSENVIGKLHDGQIVLKSLMNEMRVSIAPISTTITKNILNGLISEIRKESDEKNLLHETDSIKGSLGQLATQLYAMESVTYLTTGLIDNYENQDIDAESIISKVFASEQTMNCASIALTLLGISASSQSHWIHSLYKDAMNLKIFYESDDGLKMILALLCLQHAGEKLNELVNKIRNPLFHSTFNLKRMWTNRRNNEDNPKLDLELGDYLHPALFNSSQQLEYCIKRLEFAAEIMLARYGPEVVNYHMDLKRLGDAIIDTYVMTAVIARSSRSYCIGLQNGDQEITLALCYCNSAVERVKDIVNKIYNGPYHTNDQNFRIISKKLFKFKEYFPKHPLTRNF